MITAVELFKKDDVKKKFENLLGAKSSAFITSVLQVVQSSALLEKADPTTVYQAAATAAALNLPLNNNLGFAYIIPYAKKNGETVAQFQMGYKGFIQLAMRSGEIKTIAACPICEGQLISANMLTGYVFDFNKKKSDKVIGYAAYFSLLSGFEKTEYMTREQVDVHAYRFSQAYKRKYGPWMDDFDAMAQKTVLKKLLSKYAPLSVDLNTAILADQAVVIDHEAGEVQYIDNGDDKQEAITVEEIQELFEKYGASLSEELVDRALAIIKNNDVKAFPKLKATLLKMKEEKEAQAEKNKELAAKRKTQEHGTDSADA